MLPMLLGMEDKGCTRDAIDVFKGREGVKSMDQKLWKNDKWSRDSVAL